MREREKIHRSLVVKAEQIAYDFTQFTIDDFIVHISKQIGRNIEIIEAKLPVKVGGFWVRERELALDYIVVNSLLPMGMRLQVLLHEVAHVICGHKTMIVTPDELKDMLKVSCESRLVSEGVLYRRLSKYTRQHDNEQENEAEELATWFHMAIQQGKRNNCITRNPNLDRFTIGWG